MRNKHRKINYKINFKKCSILSRCKYNNKELMTLKNKYRKKKKKMKEKKKSKKRNKNWKRKKK
jgi:hypothetical protein